MISSVVEHFLGKEEVVSSSLIDSSETGRNWVATCFFMRHPGFSEGRSAAQGRFVRRGGRRTHLQHRVPKDRSRPPRAALAQDLTLETPKRPRTGGGK